MENDLDKKLYNDYLNGEKKAFELLYNKYKNRIEYFIYNIVKDYYIAEDVTQETFIYAMQNRMKENISFKYYIYMVAKSRAINYINTEKRRNDIREKYISNNSEKIEKDVLEFIEKEETKKEILDSIDLLDDKYKNAIYLTQVEELSYKEASKILGESIFNIKNYVHRGKKKLKNNLLKEKNDSTLLKTIIIIFIAIILTGGIVFEKDVKAIIKYYFGMSNAIDVAADNGYVEETNMNFIETENELIAESDGIVIDDVDVSVKIDEFLIDDINFVTNFSFKFDDKIKEFLDLDNLQFIFLPDLVIYDEENRIIGTDFGSKKVFDEICKEHNLNYDYNEFILSGPTRRSIAINERNRAENLIKAAVNFEATEELFPNSKELNFVFTKIKLEKYNEYNGEDINNGELLKSKVVTITGDWKINVKVPEKMYNRPKFEYKVVNISNQNVEVDYAIASETGFKFNAILSNIKEPDYSNKPFDNEIDELYEQRDSGKITEEECNKKVYEIMNTEEYINKTRKWYRENEIITMDYTFFEENEEKSIDKITHITNSKGKNFIIKGRIFRMDISNENDYKFTTTFDMPQNNATDKLTLTLILYGEPIYIELEKVKI